MLVLPNLYGDIISDLTAGLVGGLGVAPGANIGAGGRRLRGDARIGAEVQGPEQGQPDGDDPLREADARPLGERDAADRLEDAVAAVIAEGKSVTYDMKPTRDDPTAVGTSEYADAIIERLGWTAGRAEKEHVNGRKKVTVVGAGNVGATCAQEVARRDYADVVLVDIKPNFAAGKALDINQAGSVLGYEPTIVGVESGYAATAGSDVVVITAGLPRKPGMSRDDLVTTNEAIVADGDARRSCERSPKAVARRRLEPARRDVPRREGGLGVPEASASSAWPGILDTSRFAASSPGRPGSRSRRSRRWCSAATATRWSRSSRRRRSAASRSTQLVTQREDQQDGGADRRAAASSSKLLGTSAWYAPGAAAAQMVDAICLDEKRVLPCTAYLEGEYGITGLYMGVPVRLGAGGVEEVVKLKLTRGGEEDAEGVRGGGARRRVVLTVVAAGVGRHVTHARSA